MAFEGYILQKAVKEGHLSPSPKATKEDAVDKTIDWLIIASRNSDLVVSQAAKTILKRAGWE